MTTHDAATEVIQAQNHDAQHRRQRSQQIIWTVLPIAVIFSVVALVVSMLALNRQKQDETDRANQASVAVEELCDQVRRMGAVCVVNPDDFRGERGDVGPAGERGIQGPRGPVGPAGPVGPSGAPGAVGPAGPTGPRGENGGPGCTLIAVTVRDAVTKKLVRILACT